MIFHPEIPQDGGDGGEVWRTAGEGATYWEEGKHD